MAQGITGYFDIGDSTYNPSRFKLRVHYSESYDVSTNKSVLTISKLQAMSVSPYSWYGLTYYLNGTISIAGQTAVTMNSASGTHPVTLSSYDVWYDVSGTLGSVTVSHNSDGTGSAAISASVTMFIDSPGSMYGNGAKLSGSKTVTLTTIPRTSKPSVSGEAVCGSSLVIYTNRKTNAFTHTLRYTFGSASGTIATGVGDSFSWTVPYDLAKQIRSAATGSGTIYCDTYNGSTKIGTESAAFTVRVPNNDTTKPAMNLSLSPTGSLPSAFSGMYVQGKTALRVAFNASSTYSTVKSCTLTVEGKTYTGDTATSSVISGSGNIAYTCTVTDTRGYSRQISGTINVLPYAKPYLSDVVCYRTNSGGSPDTGGTYVRLKFTRNFASVNGKNGCTVKRRHKAEGGSYSAYTTIAVPSGGSYNENIPGITTDPEKAYQIQILVEDTVGESNTYTFDIPSQFHTIHLREGGKGIAFGKRSDSDLFDCAMEAKFRDLIRDATGFTSIKLVRRIEYSEIDPTHNNPVFFKEWIKAICRENPNMRYTTFMGAAVPYRRGFVIYMPYDTSRLNDNGLPEMSGGIFISAYDGKIVRFGTNGYAYQYEGTLY